MRPAEVRALFADAELMELAERAHMKSIESAEAFDARCIVMQGAIHADSLGKTELREHVIDHLSERLVVLDDIIADAAVVSDALPEWLKG